MNHRPLHCLVHIPKTAGSSVNEAMKLSGLDCWPHLEGVKHDASQLNRIVNTADFISGHIPFREFRSIVSFHTSRKVVFHSFIREPTKQVSSHYNWLIEIYHRGPEFYGAHSPAVKEISERIRGSNNNNAVSIIENLQHYSDFFCNLQTFYLLEKRTWVSLIDELSAIDNIWLSSELDEFLNFMGFGQCAAPNSNVSNYHFREEIFFEPEIQEFLNINNQSDNELYKNIR